jgi:hypothetical protein
MPAGVNLHQHRQLSLHRHQVRRTEGISLILLAEVAQLDVQEFTTPQRLQVTTIHKHQGTGVELRKVTSPAIPRQAHKGSCTMVA